MKLREGRVSMQTTVDPGAAPQAETNNLLTSAEYLESLRDARNVHLYGERIADVTTHPAFRNSARSVARLYDTLHDPDQRDLLTTVDDYGIRTHKFFKPSTTAQEPLAARDAIAALDETELRLHGPYPRLQGRLHGEPEGQPRVLQALRRQRPELVQALHLARPLPQPRPRQPPR